MNRSIRNLSLGAIIAGSSVFLLGHPRTTPAQQAGRTATSPQFFRLGHHVINGDAITHVTEYNNELTVWFAGKDSTVYIDIGTEAAAMRRWLEDHPAGFWKIGPHYFRADRISHTRNYSSQSVEIYFFGGNRFSLRKAEDVAALNRLLAPRDIPPAQAK